MTKGNTYCVEGKTSGGNQLKTKFKMFTLNSNRKLASEMAEQMGCDLGKCKVTRFSDGEIYINIEDGPVRAVRRGRARNH